MMIEPSSRGQDPSSIIDTDARGNAALLLAESLMHGLISRRILSASDAIDIVDTAIHVQRDTIAELSEQDRTMAQSLVLLIDIKRSLDTDLPRD